VSLRRRFGRVHRLHQQPAALRLLPARRPPRRPPAAASQPAHARADRIAVGEQRQRASQRAAPAIEQVRRRYPESSSPWALLVSPPHPWSRRRAGLFWPRGPYRHREGRRGLPGVRRAHDPDDDDPVQRAAARPERRASGRLGKRFPWHLAGRRRRDDGLYHQWPREPQHPAQCGHRRVPRRVPDLGLHQRHRQRQLHSRSRGDRPSRCARREEAGQAAPARRGLDRRIAHARAFDPPGRQVPHPAGRPHCLPRGRALVRREGRAVDPGPEPERQRGPERPQRRGKQGDRRLARLYAGCARPAPTRSRSGRS